MNVRGHDGRYRPVPDYDDERDQCGFCSTTLRPVDGVEWYWCPRCREPEHGPTCSPGQGCTCGATAAQEERHQLALRRHLEGDRTSQRAGTGR